MMLRRIIIYTIAELGVVTYFVMTRIEKNLYHTLCSLPRCVEWSNAFRRYAIRNLALRSRN